MKIKVLKFGISALICAVLLNGFSSSIISSANSGPSSWSGNTVSGAYFTGESCPLKVEREILTFDIPEVNYDYATEEWYKYYNGSVTAEYIFKNPTQEFISATLAFPFGIFPYYPESQLADDKFGVKINRKEVNSSLRHSWCAYGSSFDFAEEVSKLCDGYKADGFFYPEMPVYRYLYNINAAMEEGFYARAEIGLNNPAIRLGAFGNLDLKKGAATITAYVGGDGKGEILSFGGEIDFSSINWRFYTESWWGIFRSKKNIRGAAELVSTEILTFKEYAIAGRKSDSAISEIDYYNGAVDYLNFFYQDGALPITMGNFTETSFMRWFVYHLELAPNDSVQNTVTAPVYPTVYFNYDPFKYGVQYLLSPAKGWAGFGEIELIINTPYLITDCDYDLQRTENGYRGVIEKLPEGELEFELCKTLTPKYTKKGYGYGLVFLFFGPLIIVAVVLIIFVIVTLVKRRKNARRT